MYKSEYLNRLLENLETKYYYQPEFLNAVKEFFDSMDLLVEKDHRIQENAILERIVEPDRIIQFKVTWIDDSGKIQVNTGYRVQFNNAIGPYKGGTRFDKSVNLSILKFLGFEQIFKNSLTGLPMGGGKGGSDFNPKGKSDREIMRFCQAYVQELYRYIGPNTDVPAGDLGCGSKEIGYIAGAYKKLKNVADGTFTGKGPSFGGSLLRPEATGYGLLYFTQEMLKEFCKTDIKGKKVIISGAGNVASFALKKAKELGAIVVGSSNSRGCIIDENGLDIDLIFEGAQNRGNFIPKYLEKYPNVKFSNNPRDIWQAKCDIALPCATQDEIYLKEAKTLKKNGCFMVVEGANMPCNIEAVRFFNENGILFSPGKASNAGGVSVSGLEMTQDAMHYYWTEEEVDEKLKGIMKSIFKQCHEAAIKLGEPNNIALGANVAGFLKVYEAMLAQGII